MRFLHPWDSTGKSTRVGYHFLLQGIFLTQGSNPVSHIASRCLIVLMVVVLNKVPGIDISS